jgi:hypothetical protein
VTNRFAAVSRQQASNDTGSFSGGLRARDGGFGFCSIPVRHVYSLSYLLLLVYSICLPMSSHGHGVNQPRTMVEEGA